MMRPANECPNAKPGRSVELDATCVHSHGEKMEDGEPAVAIYAHVRSPAFTVRMGFELEGAVELAFALLEEAAKLGDENAKSAIAAVATLTAPRSRVLGAPASGDAHVHWTPWEASVPFACRGVAVSTLLRNVTCPTCLAFAARHPELKAADEHPELCRCNHTWAAHQREGLLDASGVSCRLCVSCPRYQPLGGPLVYESPEGA